MLRVSAGGRPLGPAFRLTSRPAVSGDPGGLVGPLRWGLKRPLSRDLFVLNDWQVGMPEIMRRRRDELGLSQAALAAAVGVDRRQIRRYEAGEQQPLLSVAVAIADALGVSVTELAGVPVHRVELAGIWWSVWQTFKDREEIITSQEVRIGARQSDRMTADALSRGSVTLEEGGYLWRGELRIWDNEVLMGWYAADDGSVRSKGTMYFVLHPHGINMTGRWVGLSYDGAIVTGWAAMAKSEADARALIGTLKEQERPA